MPHSHQPPKFKQFGGKGNPNQYIAVMLELKETDWWNNLCDLLKKLHLTSKQTLPLSLLITGGKWKMSSYITSIAHAAQSA